jgi:hypothetical protein
MPAENFSPSDLALYVAVVISIIILGFGAVVLYKIVTGKIPLRGLIEEPREADGDARPKASLSRFQFLVFTFVIAGLYLVLSLETGSFVDIPESVLALLGISGGSYLISKGVGGRKAAPTAPPAPDTPQPPQT